MTTDINILEQAEEIVGTWASNSADPYVRGQHKNCDCPLPIIKKAWNDYLGVAVVIRFCCALKALQELTGKDNIYVVSEYEPSIEWDESQVTTDPKTGKPRRVGPPPTYLQDRFDRKGIKTKK